MPFTGNYQVSSADLDDQTSIYNDAPLLTESTQQTTDDLGNTTSQINNIGNTFKNLGSYLASETLKKYANAILDESYRLMGQGASNNIMQNFLSRLDRHGTTLTPLNTMNYGYTFITRPRLNMTSANLRQHPVLATFNSMEPNSVPFMIRALLDTRLSRGKSIYRGAQMGQYVDEEANEFVSAVHHSGLVDMFNPFFIPLCNGLKGISGFPDFNIEVETTEGDFHSGDYSFVKGSDMNNRTQELSLEFRDVQGSIILSCIFVWCLMMALQAKGVCMAYPDDIYEQRLNYTVSIYRFITDTSRKNILWWAKATGCFPKSAPVGALFNVNQGEVTISSAANFSIPFTANDVKINDPGILLDFNKLMQNYCKNITNRNEFFPLGGESRYNFNALPYIKSSDMGLELQWLTNAAYADTVVRPDPDTQSLDQLHQATEEAREQQDLDERDYAGYEEDTDPIDSPREQLLEDNEAMYV